MAKKTTASKGIDSKISGGVQYACLRQPQARTWHVTGTTHFYSRATGAWAWGSYMNAQISSTWHWTLFNSSNTSGRLQTCVSKTFQSWRTSSSVPNRTFDVSLWRWTAWTPCSSTSTAPIFSGERFGAQSCFFLRSAPITRPTELQYRTKRTPTSTISYGTSCMWSSSQKLLTSTHVFCRTWLTNGKNAALR